LKKLAFSKKENWIIWLFYFNYYNYFKLFFWKNELNWIS
jgi:hypothetical protein